MEKRPDELLCLERSEIFKLAQAKCASNKFVILKETLKPLSERLGYLGEYANLKLCLKYDDDQAIVQEEFEFFVKFFPRIATCVKFASKTGAFDKEIFMYDIFEKFHDEGIDIYRFAPRCYLKLPNKALVMDDLISEGYSNLDKHLTLSLNNVIAILKSLAHLHASSLIYEEKMSKNYRKTYRLIDEFSAALEEGFFNDRENYVNQTGIDASIKGILGQIRIFNLPPTLQSGAKFERILEEVCYKIYEMVKPSEKYRNVLNHGDLWTANLMMKYQEDGRPIQCKLVDYQWSRYLPPAADLMSLLFLTTSKDFRNDHSEELIDLYYENLAGIVTEAGFNIEEILPRSTFLVSCKEYAIFGLLQAAFYFPLILIRNDHIVKYFSDTELCQKALYQNRSLLVEDNIKFDIDYEARLRECMQELKDYCDKL